MEKYVLVKYYGLVLNDNNHFFPRDEFLSNGLFRITQPKFLNDKGSEGRLYPYFNEFSPADYEWARKEERKHQVDLSYKPSNEELEKLFLRPFCQRYGDAFPHMVQSQTGYKNMEEYDKETFTKLVEQINSLFVELLSCAIGVLSLSKSDKNEHMWTHYASEGKGIALEFDDNHDFFNLHKFQDVSYKDVDRAFVTYYKGSVRFNGVPLKDIALEKQTSILALHYMFAQSKIDINDFTKRILFSKAGNWSLEDEARIVFDLSLSDNKVGESIKPKVDDKVLDMIPGFFRPYSEICLKKIPFSAFKTLVFGYNIDPEVKRKIIDKAKSNPELQHLKFKKVKHNIYGKLETVQIDV